MSAKFSFKWSHSSLVEFRQCPYKFYRKRVVRDVSEPMSPEMENGNIVHKMFEDRVNTDAPFPPAFARYETMIRPVLEWPGSTTAEVAYGITAECKATAFFAPDVWGRAKIDILNVSGARARIVDWKTGKVRDGDSREQFRTNALIVFANEPEVNVVTGAWVYLNYGKITPFTATRDEAPAVLAAVQRDCAEVDYAVSSGTWARRPTPLCGWCPVTDCPNWKPKPPRRS